MRKSSPLRHIGLLILRVGFSATMLMHGWGKLEKLIAGGAIKFPDPLGIGTTPSIMLAVVGEFIAPILIIIGLKTRISAIPAAVTMGVAFFVIHSGDSISDREMSLLYLFAFTAIAMLGAGKYSIDGALRKRR